MEMTSNLIFLTLQYNHITFILEHKYDNHRYFSTTNAQANKRFKANAERTNNTHSLTLLTKNIHSIPRTSVINILA